MNPYYNFFRDETLSTILLALKPLTRDLKEEILDIIRINIVADNSFYEFETKDFIDRPKFSLLL